MRPVTLLTKGLIRKGHHPQSNLPLASSDRAASDLIAGDNLSDLIMHYLWFLIHADSVSMFVITRGYPKRFLRDSETWGYPRLFTPVNLLYHDLPTSPCNCHLLEPNGIHFHKRSTSSQEKGGFVEFRRRYDAVFQALRQSVRSEVP